MENSKNFQLNGHFYLNSLILLYTLTKIIMFHGIFYKIIDEAGKKKKNCWKVILYFFSFSSKTERQVPWTNKSIMRGLMEIGWTDTHFILIRMKNTLNSTIFSRDV